jgi:hypothetical protein
LFQHGLIALSFVPNQQIRHLRDLTRMRTKVTQDRARVVNRIEAVLEDANIKLSSVVTDIMGASAQAMVKAKKPCSISVSTMAPRGISIATANAREGAPLLLSSQPTNSARPLPLWSTHLSSIRWPSRSSRQTRCRCDRQSMPANKSKSFSDWSPFRLD